MIEFLGQRQCLAKDFSAKAGAPLLLSKNNAATSAIFKSNAEMASEEVQIKRKFSLKTYTF